MTEAEGLKIAEEAIKRIDKGDLTEYRVPVSEHNPLVTMNNVYFGTKVYLFRRHLHESGMWYVWKFHSMEQH